VGLVVAGLAVKMEAPQGFNQERMEDMAAAAAGMVAPVHMAEFA
jgi:hypothetical protein